MDKTNIISVFEELQTAQPDKRFILTFLADKNMGEEPTVQLSVRAESNLTVSLYLTEQECQEITTEEISEKITFLVRQEIYRRTIIFATALQGAIDDANTHKK